MRKVLSFVLVLSLVLGSFSMAFAAQASDLAGEDYETAAGALMDLGVINGYPDGTFGGGKEVTRAEMAAMVCQALGLSEAAGGNTFKDAQTHWAKGWVGLAQSLGVITGYSDGTFRPDRNVTDYEAVTMIVKALGYNQDSAPGVWPSNYIARAQKEDILDGVKITGENALRGTIATMLYQTLAVPIGTTDKDGKWTADERNKQSVTMYTLLGATANDEVVIRSTSARTNLMPYIGAYATVYRDSKTKDILAIADVKTDYLVGNFTTITGNLIFEDEDGVKYNVPNHEVEYFYNAEEDGVTSIAAILDPSGSYGVEDGDCVLSVDIVGKTIRQVYALMVWDANDDFQFKSADATDIKENQELGSCEFQTTKSGDIIANQFQLLGVDSLDDIKVNNIVAVYADSDDVITRVEVGTEVVSGKITQVSSKNKVTIDGKGYDETSLYNGSDKDIKAGNEVKLFLDYAGEWYKAELISGKADNVAIVVGMEDGNPTKLTDKNAKIELFMADGTSKVFTVAKDAATDDSGYDLTPYGILTGQAIKYGLNSSGQVNSITTYAAVTKATADITKKGTYSGREFASNAVIFSYPDLSGFNVDGSIAGGIDSDDFKVTALSKILDTEKVDAFYCIDDKGRIEAMLYEATEDDAIYGFLIAYGKNSSDAGKYLEFLIDGKAVTYDSNVSATNFTVLYEVKLKDDEVSKAVATNVGISVTASTTACSISLDGNMMTITDNGDFVTDGAIGFVSGDKVTIDSEAYVYVWDVKDEKYKAGKRSDLKSATLLLLYDTDDDGVYDVIAVTKS